VRKPQTAQCDNGRLASTKFIHTLNDKHDAETARIHCNTQK